MNPITVEDLYSFSFYGGMRSKGSSLGFVKAIANVEKNDYDYDLMLLKDGKVRQMTDRKSVSSFVYQDKKTIWFAQPSEDKKSTVLYALSLKGGEALEKGTIDLAGAQIVGFLNKNTMLISCFAPLQKEEDKDADDYEILNEAPWYLNNAGFIAGKRTSYYLYDLKKQKLSDSIFPDLDVDALSIKNEKIFIAAQPSNHKILQELADTLYEYDVKERKLKALKEMHLDVYQMLATKKQVYIFATDHTPIGESSNPNLYIYNLDESAFNKAADFDEALGNTVGTDCALLGGNATGLNKNTLYFTQTIVNRNILYKYENEKVQKVLDFDGTIHAFAFMKGVLYFIGAKPNALQELYVYQNGHVSQISNFQKQMEGKYVAEAKPIFFTGAVDTEQVGWVLYPKDYDPNKKYPGILDIHGGPKTVYGTIFYHEMQVWASKGYFVFFCNPFGSDGQGNAYADLRDKYGTIDYEDLMKFTDKVLEEVPQIDPERLGVTGGSYGGFMTNWIITHTNRFKAAASQRSISNWTSFWGTSDIGPEFTRDQQGADIDNVQKLWEHSPISKIKDAKTPTLFIHSDQDYRCPIEQGYQMLNGLLHNGVEAKMVLFHGENHELSRSGKPAHRVKRLTEITNWMDNHLSKN